MPGIYDRVIGELPAAEKPVGNQSQSQSQVQSQSQSQSQSGFDSADMRQFPGTQTPVSQQGAQVVPEKLEDPTRFVGRLNGLTPQAVQRRLLQSQTMIEENAIISPAWAQDQTADSAQPRPWPLDAVPFVLTAEEDNQLHEALDQRARVLKVLLADLLGEQRFIRSGLVPAVLLYANKRYHRAYQELSQDLENGLTMYAADVAQADDGKWWVTGDRTQAPSGLGFTLENRVAAARAHPDLFWPLQVRRHVSFFMSLNQRLREAAVPAGASPSSAGGRIVILSEDMQAGHRAFEDGYLARYLRHARVEGGDLAVRNGRTTIKTIGGTMPVDVVFRRINDDQCDPVELDSTSTQGVAGLLESVRNGSVRTVNALGTQLVESPAWLAFLPALCKEIYGEALKLPSLASWWCGQAKERRHVLAHLDELNLYPAFRTGAKPIDTRLLTKERRANLIQDIKQHPEQYVGQERLRRATTPVWENDRLTPWRWSMRRFLVADGKGAFESLPGGLVRVSPDPAVLDDATAASVRVQDCWVPSEDAINTSTLLAPKDQPLAIQRVGAELPSRVADNLYWLGRTVEQAEFAARLLRMVLGQATDDQDVHDQPQLPIILGHMAQAQQIGSSVVDENGRLQDGFAETVVQSALAPGLNDNLRGLIREAMRLAQLVRDRLAVDAWRLLTRMDRFVTAAANRPGGAHPTDVLALMNHVVLEFVAFGGLMSESMTRTLGWRFMDIGRRLQRAQLTTGLIAHTLVRPSQDEAAVLSAVLEACDCTMTYQARYRAVMQAPAVLDLLITDDTTPRSIAFQLNQLDDHVAKLPIEGDLSGPSLHIRVVDRALGLVQKADPMNLAGVGHVTQRGGLNALLEGLGNEFPLLDQALSSRYLIHSGMPRQFNWWAKSNRANSTPSQGGAR